jgi:hypothetical protein
MRSSGTYSRRTRSKSEGQREQREPQRAREGQDKRVPGSIWKTRTLSGERESSQYCTRRRRQRGMRDVLVTDLVPSEMACLESSPGRMSRTEVWISRDEMVDFLLYEASLEASEAIR